MKLHIFAIHDKAANAYLQPIFSNAEGVVIRQFGDLLDSPNHETMRQHPHDYCLYKLGIYDDNKGQFLTHEPQKIIGLWEFNQTNEETETIEAEQ